MRYKVIHWIIDSTYDKDFNSLEEAKEYILNDVIKGRNINWQYEGLEIIAFTDSQALNGLSDLEEFLERQK